MASTEGYSTPLVRWYVDTRTLVPPSNSRTNPVTLPLLSTLPKDNQDAITRFLRAEDKFMSLASALLKFTFIHRYAKIPWSEVQISRTPKPHGRPFWDPPSSWHGDGFDGLEFNVSHQAGMITLAGCRTPDRPDVAQNISHSDTSVIPDPAQQQRQQLRIGVDVTCTKEPRRTPDLSTQPKLNEWVDTFSEMFSARERQDMKERPVRHSPKAASSKELEVMEQKARRFYTYWGLKEAYIKMVGEGLLADWLRQLEFTNVMCPQPGEMLTAKDAGMVVLFKGRDITDAMQLEMSGIQESFLFMMMTRGITEQQTGHSEWMSLDINTDIQPCAEGRCSCLD